ncbi:hypothetical protein T4D_4168 [Trichinella pseudospiralis]|uniref:Uncharacterized protein n=1 Tax=Trichinella pseudospiralis TaxID=6337 RepID=A0A0V1DNC9_TRIPS|nr:hypothetical protein T4D_4168 [Trichinella pseudospiralis]
MVSGPDFWKVPRYLVFKPASWQKLCSTHQRS